MEKLQFIIDKTGFVPVLAYKDKSTKDWRFIVEENGELKKMTKIQNISTP